MHFSTCRGTPAEVELSVFHYTGRPSRLVWSVTEMTMTMIKCACGRENPADTIFCFCGRQVAPPPAPKLDGPSEEDLQKLQERVEQLQRDLLIKDKEIEALQRKVTGKTDEAQKELSAKHPELQDLLQQLDAKDAQLQKSLKELDELREEMNRARQQEPEGPGVKPRLIIESHPIKKPNFNMIFDDAQQSLDLSTTRFRIGASIERNADGSVGVVIHDGATVNIQGPGSKRWRRYTGGARVSADPGMVLFDVKGEMSARLDRAG